LRRFDQFQADLGITRHVLADRLKKLDAAGLLERRPYQERPKRYEYRLTQAGKDFAPTMMSLIGWANAHIPTKETLPFEFLSRDTGEPPQVQVVDENTGEPITFKSLTISGLD
jgi:DNA-binding HxlR family transcriptional regulator